MLDKKVDELNEEELKNLSVDELDQLLEEQRHNYKMFKNLQMSVKIFMNSVYGALANIWFGGFNINLPTAITLEGQKSIKFAEKIVNYYFHNKWHKDTELHKKMGITNVTPISPNKDLVSYIDTDSVAGDSSIIINDKSDTIENAFKELSKFYNNTIDPLGNEVITINDNNVKTKNWSKERGMHDVPVSKFIRHKVTKSKWKLKTKSGKEVIVTDDHSMIVLRNGNKIKIKPSEINLKTDKIVSIKK